MVQVWSRLMQAESCTARRSCSRLSLLSPRALWTHAHVQNSQIIICAFEAVLIREWMPVLRWRIWPGLAPSETGKNGSSPDPDLERCRPACRVVGQLVDSGSTGGALRRYDQSPIS